MRLTIALIPLVFVSCLPKRLVPYDFTIEKNNTEAFVEMDSITVAIANLEVKSDHYIFGMAIENHSSQPIFIDMDKVKKYANDLSYREETSFDRYQQVTTAMTPKQVNVFFKAKRDNAEAAAFFLFFVGAAIATYDAVKDNEDSRKEYWNHDDEKKSQNRDLITASTLAVTDILSDVAVESRNAAQTELHYLPAELFDREVIYPGENYYGKVLFRRVSSVKEYHRITFPHEGKKLHFDFRKATYKERNFLIRQGF